MPRPHKFYDPQGYARVTLKKGSDRQPGGAQPHAQYVQTGGRRVDSRGKPVRRTALEAFVAIEWDLEDEDREDLGEGAEEDLEQTSTAIGEGNLDFDEVAALAAKSPVLMRALQSLDASGFSLSQGPESEGNQVIIGAARVLVDPALAREHTLTGVVAREIGRALFVSPKVSARGRSRDEFVTQNVDISLRDEGEALLFAEQVRSEIVAGGGPDIGVPGVPGPVLALCEAVRLGQAPRTESAREIGRAALKPHFEDAQARYAELWDMVFDRISGLYGAG